MAYVLIEQSDGILTLTLDRPKANAFTMELIVDLQKAFKQAARDPQIRCVVLTAAGKVFGAGQDIEEFKTAGPELSYRSLLQKSYNPLVMQIRQLEKPVIASINGPVAGASLGVALACDLRIAVDTARFVVGFAGIGLVPDCSVSLLLPKLIGLGRATEFTFTNAPISAQQALDWGLVNRVVPAEQLKVETHKLAAQLAAGPVGAFGLAKRAFNKTILPNLEEALDYEAHLQEIAGHGSEHREGVDAFLEKRPPQYN